MKTKPSSKTKIALEPGIMRLLTAEERRDLNHLETIIQNGWKVFLQVGGALIEIRDRKLYRAQYKTFEAYLKIRWGLSRPRGYQLIDSANLAKELGNANEPPPNSERVARELGKFPSDMRKSIWRKAQKIAGDYVKVNVEDVRRAATSVEGVSSIVRDRQLAEVVQRFENARRLLALSISFDELDESARKRIGSLLSEITQRVSALSEQAANAKQKPVTSSKPKDNPTSQKSDSARPPLLLVGGYEIIDPPISWQRDEKVKTLVSCSRCAKPVVGVLALPEIVGGKKRNDPKRPVITCECKPAIEREFKDLA